MSYREMFHLLRKSKQGPAKSNSRWIAENSSTLKWRAQCLGLWCKNEKKDYKPRNLPFGKPLTCQDFRHALENLF